MKTAEFWIKRAMEKTGATSERKLAEALEANSSLISKIRRGDRRMPPELCQKIADITGEDYASILVSIMADKAKDDNEGKALFSLIKRANPALFKTLRKATESALCKVHKENRSMALFPV